MSENLKTEFQNLLSTYRFRNSFSLLLPNYARNIFNKKHHKMMEHTPQEKRDEQYPLLKVEAGGGDNVMRAQTDNAVSPSGWHVACTPKQSWCNRWPEFVSACWMTVILLAISFLIFYALGMSAYRRQPVVIIRCNDSKPASEVFYHFILSRDSNVPFPIFSKYLSFMAKQYPQLRFNVFFLYDDSWQNSIQGSKHLRFLKRLIPQISGFNTIVDQSNKRAIKDFQRRYQNVNITLQYLSKYMAMTPLKYNWRTIPLSYLSFYARIHAIWQNGGIGFDLVSFNNQYNNNHAIDNRVDAILKQHNDGIKVEKYADTIDAIDKEEQNELFSMFSNLISQIINETGSFFGANLISDIKVIDNTNNTLVRTHRSKRDIKAVTITTNDSDVFNFKINNQTTNKNLSESNNTSEEINVYKMNNYIEINDTKKDIEPVKHRQLFDLFKITNISEFNVDMPQVLFFYDLSLFPDDIGPPYTLSKTVSPTDHPSVENSAKYSTKHGESKLKYLSLSPEGHFVAASSRHHPFLAQLLSAGCQRVTPKHAIKDTLLSQCSGFMREDVYCENIRVISNVI